MLRRTLLYSSSVLLLSCLCGPLMRAQEATAANDYGRKLPSPPAEAHVTLGQQKLITVHYSTPSMRGRKIFGGLVPYDHVWRTGANPATSFKTEANLKIGDLSVPAGSYTLYSLPSESGTWKLILNRQTGQWGTIYNQNRDLGRVDMQKAAAPAAPVDRFEIKFENTQGSTTELHLIWENTDVFVPISVQ